jgi:hypothetical protein
MRLALIVCWVFTAFLSNCYSSMESFESAIGFEGVNYFGFPLVLCTTKLSASQREHKTQYDQVPPIPIWEVCNECESLSLLGCAANTLFMMVGAASVFLMCGTKTNGCAYFSLGWALVSTTVIGAVLALTRHDVICAQGSYLLMAVGLCGVVPLWRMLRRPSNVVQPSRSDTVPRT